MFNLEELLKKAHQIGACDIHLNEGKVPSFRVNGKIVKAEGIIISESDFDEIMSTVARKDILEDVKKSKNADFTYEIPNLSRYRVNFCLELGTRKLTLRVISYDIPTLSDLNLPLYLHEFTKYNNGIILVTGPTGSGKTTTLASIIEIINREQQKHIITIEDPVEYVYTDKKSLITQRGLGVDTDTFQSGIKYALRQDPDVILVGEIRDKDTLESAIVAAETGHLVFSTLHTNSSIQTVNRILGFFGDDRSSLIVQRVVNALRATVSQKLIPNVNGGLSAAVEIMTVTPTIADYLLKGNYDDIYNLMYKSKFDDLITMNSSINSLVQKSIITQEMAMTYSDNKNELAQLIKGVYHSASQMDFLDDDII